MTNICEYECAYLPFVSNLYLDLHTKYRHWRTVGICAENWRARSANVMRTIHCFSSEHTECNQNASAVGLYNGLRGGRKVKIAPVHVTWLVWEWRYSSMHSEMWRCHFWQVIPGASMDRSAFVFRVKKPKESSLRLFDSSRLTHTTETYIPEHLYLHIT